MTDLEQVVGFEIKVRKKWLDKKYKSYKWRIYEKLFLCLASGICWGLIIWIGVVLVWNGFSYPEQEITPFYPRLVFGSLVLFFFVSPYFYPGVYVLPIWILSLIIFYFQLSSEIGSIYERHDISSPHYAPDTTWDLYNNSFDIFILAMIFISLLILFRPAMLYFRIVVINIIRGN